MTRADDLSRLEKIRAHLATGATSITVDGQTVAVDLQELRREERLIEERVGLRARRRRVFGFDMSSR